MDGPTPLHPATQLFFDEMVELATVTEECGDIDLSSSDPQLNKFHTPFPVGIVARLGRDYGDRLVNLRDGCRLPAALYRRIFWNRFKCCRN